MFTVSRLFALGAVSFALLQAPAMADTEKSDKTHLHFNASVQEEVDADTVRLTLSKQLSGENQQALTEELNKAINAVLEKGKSEKALIVRNGDYGFWSAGEKGKNLRWEMRGEVIVTTKDFDKARDFIAATKDDMSLDGIRFYLSDEAKKKVEAGLIDKAAQAFKEKAEAASKAFGFQSYKIESIHLDTSGGYEGRMLRAASVSARAYSAADTADTVDISGGKVSVTVSANGSISLH